MSPAEMPVERRPGGPRISYAQNLEDILLDRVLGDRRGRYLDIGANHPFLDSNTYFFYLRGWRGTTIEPTETGHRRIVELRPEDLNLRTAASDQDGTLRFFEVERDGDQTGLSTSDAATAREHERQGFRVREHTVPSRTIASILVEHDLPPVDLVSLDVEGHELAVLKGIPLDRWRPEIFVIESTEPLHEAPSYTAWEPLLLDQGYRFATFNGVNRFYVREDRAAWIPTLQVPVNHHDCFLRHDLVATQLRLDESRAILEAERGAWQADRQRFETQRLEYQQAIQQFAEARAAWTWETEASARQRNQVLEKLWEQGEHLKQSQLRESVLEHERAELLRRVAELEEALRPPAPIAPGVGNRLLRTGLERARRLKGSLRVGRS